MKRTKILSLLLATTLLSGCSGSTNAIPPKDFANEGKVVTYKEGVTGFVKAVKEANYIEWAPHNYAIKNSYNMNEITETSYSKIDANSSITVDTKNSSKSSYDSANKCVKKEVYSTETKKGDGTSYDEETGDIYNVFVNDANNKEETTIAYVEGKYNYICFPTLGVYSVAELVDFDFDNYIADEYTQMLAPILLYYESFSSLPISTTEEEYKATVEELFSINPSRGDVITISLNNNVVTFNSTTNEVINDESTTTRTSKIQMVIDQTQSVFNYAYQETQTKKTILTTIKDCTKTVVRTTDFHWTSWAEDGGSVERPDINKYSKYEK